MKLVICCILFADDLVLIAKSKKDLKKLIDITQKYFSINRLTISPQKSKVMTTESGGETSASNLEDATILDFEAVCSFKYLGIKLNCNPRSIFKEFNPQVIEKAKKYLISVLSLSKKGPNRSELAYSLWTSIALPSILYGAEIMTLHENTIKYLEKCNNDVGKFILPVPKSSANTSVYIDAGLKPIRYVLAEKVLLYARSLSVKSSDYWPKIALDYNLDMKNNSPHGKLISKYTELADTSLKIPRLIKADIHRAALIYVSKMQFETAVTTFAMSKPKSSGNQTWFKRKTWVNDSAYSKTLAQFRACNIGLGNRGPASNGQRYKLCPLCKKVGFVALNNEVHLLMECPSLELYRSNSILGPFITANKILNPSISNLKLYSKFLDDRNIDNLKNRIVAMYSMKYAWHTLMNISMPI